MFRKLFEGMIRSKVDHEEGYTFGEDCRFAFIKDGDSFIDFKVVGAAIRHDPLIYTEVKVIGFISDNGIRITSVKER